MKKPQIFIIAHTMTTAFSMSGGDKNFLELGQVWKKKDCQITLVTNPVGKKMCCQAHLKPKFILLPDINPKKYSLYITYPYRLLTSIAILKYETSISDSCLILSSSHYLTDILPALFLKLKYPKTKWAIFLNLLFLNPLKGYKFAYQKGFQWPKIKETLNWLFQFPSLLIAKGFADKIFCINKEIKAALIKKGFNRSKLSYFSYGIDHPLIKKIDKPPLPIFDCLFIGRFHPQKGLGDLVSIWKKVLRAFPQARLGVIGSGPKGITQKLKNDIRKADLSPNITLLGFKDGAEKFKLLKSSQILIFPSYYESFGIVPLEAQAAGLPVVAYSLTPLKSIFKKGVLFAPIAKTGKFSHLVIKLLKDKMLYQKTAAEAKKHAQKFTWEKTADFVLEKTKHD